MMEMYGAYEGIESIISLARPKYLYRFDTRGLDEITNAGGFNSWGTDMNLLEHANGNNVFNKTSGYVSTSSSLNSTLEFSAGRKGFIYKIKPQSNGININKALGKSSPFPGENEVAVPLNIPASDIKKTIKTGN